MFLQIMNKFTITVVSKVSYADIYKCSNIEYTFRKEREMNEHINLINKIMKKLLALLVTTLMIASASAATEGISTFNRGDIDLGVMIGVPSVSESKIPEFSADVEFGIASQFINAGSTFGRNGAIGIGLYYGLTAFDAIKSETEVVNGITVPVAKDATGWKHTLLLRPTFHFEFVRGLDTYAGIFGGVHIWGHPNNTDTSSAGGIFLGSQYYFSSAVAVKLELSIDVFDGNTTPIAIGVNFKF
jgi:hypothetical protein